MQQLLGDKAGAMDSSFLCGLFLQCLPTNVHMVLASAPESITLEDLAQLADKVTEVAAPTVSSVTTSQFTSELEQLHAEVSSLKSLLKDLPPTTSNRRGRPRNHSRGQSASPAPTTEPALCWYHARFGANARKCRQPCSVGNELASH